MHGTACFCSRTFPDSTSIYERFDSLVEILASRFVKLAHIHSEDFFRNYSTILEHLRNELLCVIGFNRYDWQWEKSFRRERERERERHNSRLLCVMHDHRAMRLLNNLSEYDKGPARVEARPRLFTTGEWDSITGRLRAPLCARCTKILVPRFRAWNRASGQSPHRDYT